MQRVSLRHATLYRYDRPVRLGPHVVRLKPAPHSRARLDRYRLEVRPASAALTWHHDAFGNSFARAVFADPTERLDVDVEVDFGIGPVNPFEFLIEPWAETLPFVYDPAARHDLAPFLARPEGGAEFERAAEEWRGKGQGSVAHLGALAHAVADRVAYVPRDEPGTWSAEETLRRGEGSCRDSAWLLVEILRRNAIAARFVSGYLIELGAGSAGADRASLHAWCEAFLPGAGWIGIDGTSGLFAAEGHVPLTTASFPTGAAPIDGTVEPCAAAIEHRIDIARLA